MDGLLPFLLVAGLLVAMFLALGVWGWRRFARTSSFDTGATTAAVALRTPAEGLVAGDAYADKRSIHGDAGPRDMPDSVKREMPDVPVTVDEDDSKASDTPPSDLAPPEFLSVQEDVPKEQTPYTQDNIPASPPVPSPVAATVPADAGPSASPSDGGLGAGCDDTEQPGSRAAKDRGETLVQPSKPDDGDREVDPAPVIEAEPELPSSSIRTRPRQPAVHRDRRGSRRALPAAKALSDGSSSGPAPASRPAAEAKLRLSLHPIRRTARISVVLTRPDGFPERVTLHAGVKHVVNAYDVQRYDDLDLPWTGELLDSELHLASTDGFHWLRSARRVHVFAADPNGPDLISVGAARAGVAHALVCRSSDAADIHSAAASAGSPELHIHENWQGIPDGWTVLSDYTPTHAAALPLPSDLQPLDPGAGLEVLFEGGLAIRPSVYAAGHPPRIVIRPAPGGASITIGGEPATLSVDGAWEAPGWDVPGQHMVDVVPGPSASYEIAADPWAMAGWDFWDAYPGRFGNRALGPWARAEICGVQIRGPAAEAVFAAESQLTLVALGARSGAAPLQPRGDVAVSVGFMAEAPAFLLAATGQRRTQGRVIWLGLTPASQGSTRLDPGWVAVVRSAASRRLPLDRSDARGEDAWRKAKQRARRQRRTRT